MSYQEFLKEVSVKVSNELGHTVSVMIQKVEKDSEEKLGIVIKRSNGTAITPILYLEDVYEDFKENGNIDKCVQEVLARNKEYKLPNTIERALLKDLVNWEKMSKHIYPLLINTERNIEKLLNTDHRSYLDLALCYQVKMKADGQNITMQVNRSLSKVWNITEEELYQAAIQNMKKDDYAIVSMTDIVEKAKKRATMQEELEVLDMLFKTSLECKEKMYILTNAENKYGSAGLLDVDMIRNFAEKHNVDVFIIPASIHELILLLDNSSLDGRCIKEIVEEVNSKGLHESEVLSDNVYYYSRALGKVICLH